MSENCWMCSNSGQPDQTSSSVASDLGLQCRLRCFCPSMWVIYGMNKFLDRTRISRLSAFRLITHQCRSGVKKKPFVNVTTTLMSYQTKCRSVRELSTSLTSFTLLALFTLPLTTPLRYNVKYQNILKTFFF